MSDSLNTLDKRPPAEPLAMTPEFPEKGLLPSHPQQVADNGIAQTVQGDHARIAAPGENQFARTTGTDQLVIDRKSTRLNSSHYQQSRMPSSA